MKAGNGNEKIVNMIAVLFYRDGETFHYHIKIYKHCFACVYIILPECEVCVNVI